MRKLMIVGILLALPLMSHAKDGSDGCGLGWQIVDSETLLATTTRGTTNAFVPPTFGMTSGTIGCNKHSFVANETEAVNFVASNYVNLKQELAVGQGEYVDGLVELMNCGSAKKIQSNYDTVVAPAKDGIELYNNLKNVCG